jgi:hypothetical protein
MRVVVHAKAVVDDRGTDIVVTHPTNTDIDIIEIAADHEVAILIHPRTSKMKTMNKMKIAKLILLKSKTKKNRMTISVRIIITNNKM